MANYKIVITTSVQKYLDKLPDTVAEKLEEAMLKLEEEPRPVGCQKMSGTSAYRIRVGNYKIIYAIQDKVVLVIVLDAGARRDIYR
ncbi:MAG: type toxin-antitoxin system RelE/ParE family toxin [Segetibacter sp.]|jgi:mRNA interferase RelE/StbE|nr:type toxin-antitoxin system RelE/ParE family toxin [Segetibacter sp.]